MNFTQIFILWYLRLYMSKYLVSKGHDNGEFVKDFDIRMIPLDSQKCASETNDWGIFCLYHCATYEGKPFKCKSLTQALERRRFRAEICASLVLCNLNLCRPDVLKSVNAFCDNNEEIYAEVILNEKISKANKLVQQSLKAKRASLINSRRRSLKMKMAKQGKKEEVEARAK